VLRPNLLNGSDKLQEKVIICYRTGTFLEIDIRTLERVTKFARSDCRVVTCLVRQSVEARKAKTLHLRIRQGL
jgi:hypothetical protein